MEVFLGLEYPEYLVHSNLRAPALLIIMIRRFRPQGVLSVAYTDFPVDELVHVLGAAVSRSEVLDRLRLDEAVVPYALELY